MASLLGQGKCRLQKMVLEENPLGEEGISALEAGLQANTTLTELYFRGNNCSEGTIRNCEICTQLNKEYNEYMQVHTTQKKEPKTQKEIMLQGASVLYKFLNEKFTEGIRRPVLEAMKKAHNEADAKIKELEAGFSSDELSEAEVSEVRKVSVFFELDWDDEVVDVLLDVLNIFLFNGHTKSHTLKNREYFSFKRLLFYTGRKWGERILYWMKVNRVGLESKQTNKQTNAIPKQNAF